VPYTGFNWSFSASAASSPGLLYPLSLLGGGVGQACGLLSGTASEPFLLALSFCLLMCVNDCTAALDVGYCELLPVPARCQLAYYVQVDAGKPAP
jgi:hypothetical protein